MTLVQSGLKKSYLGSTQIKKIMLGSTQIRPAIPQYLCFTANTAGSTVRLWKTGSPTVVTLETSTDGTNWTAYTIGDTITLSNIGDKLYWRNTSETPTSFNRSGNYYYFYLTGSIAASGDVCYLLCKNSTDTMQGNYCFNRLFWNQNTSYVLTTPPLLPATTLTTQCYYQMFYNCAGLTAIPSLPATTLANQCYYEMFIQCSGIKISSTQTGEYQTEYRIPITGTGTSGTNSLYNMFRLTGGTFTGTPTINTTYYTSNTLV